jgi:hypothetical protein
MIKTYPNSPGLQDFSAKLKAIQDVYANIQVDARPKDGAAPTDKTILSADQLKAITDAVTSLRKEIIAGS